jgi:nitrite reductase/ring-hydroxylating ferredoxin subunit
MIQPDHMELKTNLTEQTVQNRVREVGINPNHWYAVGWSSELKAKRTLAITIWLQSIVLYRHENHQVYALENACPHRGVALDKGEVNGCHLICPYHGWEICLSRPKETHFLYNSPEGYSTFSTYVEQYINQFFCHCRQDHRAIGEGSVTYLYSEEVLHRILKINPDAKFIAMVRNPIDLLRSYHFWMLYLMEEDCWDFQKAWEHQTSRLQGENLPPLCRDRRLLQYQEVGKLGKWIEQLFKVVGRDRCLILVFDDFKQNPQAIYQKVCHFLDVDDDGRSYFPRRQESKFYRFRGLQRLLFHPPQGVINRASGSSTGGKLWQWQQLALIRLHRVLRNLNAVQQSSPPLTAEMTAQLQETFAEDVAKLSELLQRDLSYWINYSVPYQK